METFPFQYLFWGGLPWQHQSFIVFNPVFGSVRAIIGHNVLPGRSKCTFTKHIFIWCPWTWFWHNFPLSLRMSVETLYFAKIGQRKRTAELHGIANCKPCSPTWWRHQMEKFSALLAISAGNSPVTCEFPTQRPVTRSFDVFFVLCLNKRLSKQSWGWWFETPSRSLWRHCNAGLAARSARIDINKFVSFRFWNQLHFGLHY